MSGSNKRIRQVYHRPTFTAPASAIKNHCAGGIPESMNDNEWMAALMREFYSDMFNYGKSFTRDEDIIKDSIQEIFISLWQRRHSCNEILSPKFYFLRAVKNKVLKTLDNAERRKNKDAAPREYEFMCEFPVENNIISRETAAQDCSRLMSVVSQLSQREKEVVYLKYYQALDNAQIAELMSITRQSVYNLLYGSIVKLRASWRNQFTGG